MLSFFNILAVMTGLILTHQLIDSYSRRVHANLDWNAIHDEVARLRESVGRLNAPGNDVFESRDAVLESRRFSEYRGELPSVITSLRQLIAAKVEGPDGVNLRTAVDGIEAATGLMIEATDSLLQFYLSGDVAAAGSAMANMDRRYNEVLELIESAARMLRAIEADSGRRGLSVAQQYRRLEFVIVAMIVLMVIFVTLYGRRVTQMVEQRQAQLARFTSELESHVAQRTAELERRRAELLLQQQEAQLRNAQLDIALNNMNRGLCLFDDKQRLVLANSLFHAMYGLDAAKYPAGTDRNVILHDLSAGHGIPDLSDLSEDKRAPQYRLQSFVRTLRDGRAIEVSYYPTSTGGLVTTHDDITERCRMEQQIVHLAHHDALTGLPNRRRLREELAAAVARTERGERFAVLCLDLDHFKQVNDTLGHPIGDRLLQAVTERLRAEVRKSDIVARLSGDEFAIIQRLTGETDTAVTLAERVIETINRPFDIDGHSVVVGTSIGISFAPMDSDDADVLLKKADLALYRAKIEGKGTFRLFEDEMDARAKVRRQLELDLRRAVVKEEFELHYQPLVDAQTKAVSGFEALLRWRHPVRGLVAPNDFIPVAEAMGLMGQIGAWVLKAACKAANDWPSDCRVAVNISPVQFRSRPIELDVMAALAESGLSPHRLELEITESVLLEDTPTTIATLYKLRDCGVKIAMDDFGTGYSSLSYLHTFPFDKIKIDRTFTQSVEDSSNSQAIVKAVLGLGRNLGMSTTAEGVETESQFERLRSEGCAEVQGYFFSRPVPEADVQALLGRLSQKLAKAA